MKRINRALKTRIYPSQVQQEFLDKTLGSCRFIYNQMLGERKEVFEKLKDNKTKLYGFKYTSEKEWKEKYNFLKEVDAQALQQARRNLETAYGNFYKSLKSLRKGEKVGFPKFKSKHNHNDSYRTLQSLNIDWENHSIQVPKCKNIIFKGFRSVKSWYRLENTIVKSITISNSPSGKYFASILFEGDKDYSNLKKEIKKTTGLDMYLQNFYVDEQGNSPEYNRNYRNFEEKLKKEQLKLSLKTKGSKNYSKQRIKVARVHEKIANKRKDFTHKLSHKLVMENDCIVVESLSLKGMSQTLHLGKSVMDLGYSAFINQLKYKCEWNEKTLILADKWFASSKTCNVCGFINKELLLHERTWECPNCEALLNRDQNAAINLVNLITPQELREVPLKNIASAA
jgi:putative transposase